MILNGVIVAAVPWVTRVEAQTRPIPGRLFTTILQGLIPARCRRGHLLYALWPGIDSLGALLAIALAHKAAVSVRAHCDGAVSSAN